jgi:hypothetical protein
VGDHDHGGKAARLQLRCVPLDGDCVVALAAVDDDAVGLAVAGGAAERACEVDVDVVDVGAAQVVDGDDVGAPEGVEVDPLDAGGVVNSRCVSVPVNAKKIPS